MTREVLDVGLTLLLTAIAFLAAIHDATWARNLYLVWAWFVFIVALIAVITPNHKLYPWAVENSDVNWHLRRFKWGLLIGRFLLFAAVGMFGLGILELAGSCIIRIKRERIEAELREGAGDTVRS